MILSVFKIFIHFQLFEKQNPQRREKKKSWRRKEEREKERMRDLRDRSTFLVRFSNICQNQGWTKLRLGARNSWVPNIVVGMKVLEPLSASSQTHQQKTGSEAGMGLLPSNLPQCVTTRSCILTRCTTILAPVELRFLRELSFRISYES